jgi:hypothetical protein
MQTNNNDMGTNYYAIPRQSEENHQRIVKLINDRLYDEAAEYFPRRIHIGKSSGGWKFIFNHNNWVFYETKEGLKSFLDTCDIIDEYGRPVSGAEFWSMVGDRDNNKSHNEICRFGLEFCRSAEFS